MLNITIVVRITIITHYWIPVGGFIEQTA